MPHAHHHTSARQSLPQVHPTANTTRALRYWSIATPLLPQSVRKVLDGPQWVPDIFVHGGAAVCSLLAWVRTSSLTQSAPVTAFAAFHELRQAAASAVVAWRCSNALPMMHVRPGALLDQALLLPRAAAAAACCCCCRWCCCCCRWCCPDFAAAAAALTAAAASALYCILPAHLRCWRLQLCAQLGQFCLELTQVVFSGLQK